MHHLQECSRHMHHMHNQGSKCSMARSCSRQSRSMRCNRRRSSSSDKTYLQLPGEFALLRHPLVQEGLLGRRASSFARSRRSYRVLLPPEKKHGRRRSVQIGSLDAWRTKGVCTDRCAVWRVGDARCEEWGEEGRRHVYVEKEYLLFFFFFSFFFFFLPSKVFLSALQPITFCRRRT